MNSSHKIGAASVKLWWGSNGLLLLLSNLGMRWNTVFLHSAEMLQSWAHRLPHTALRDISTDKVTQEIIMCCSIDDRLEVAVLHFPSPFINEESVTKMSQSWYKNKFSACRLYLIILKTGYKGTIVFLHMSFYHFIDFAFYKWQTIKLLVDKSKNTQHTALV